MIAEAEFAAFGIGTGLGITSLGARGRDSGSARLRPSDVRDRAGVPIRHRRRARTTSMRLRGRQQTLPIQTTKSSAREERSDLLKEILRVIAEALARAVEKTSRILGTFLDLGTRVLFDCLADRPRILLDRGADTNGRLLDRGTRLFGALLD